MMPETLILSLTPSDSLSDKGLKWLSLVLIQKLCYFLRAKNHPPQINGCIISLAQGFHQPSL